jgi:oligopeptide/dipeptide ABC transporter ATP-binding protein
MALLEIDRLMVSIGTKDLPVLEEVSLAIDPGEVLGVVGESGSGKSMLALAIMGLLPRAARYAGGRISWDGTDLISDGPAEWRTRRGRDLAMIFQEPMTALNPVHRVGRQVEEVLVKRRGMERSAARKEALALFQRVEIPNAAALLEAFPHELSGGMRQRVMIAMALATRARLLIADEPTTALDVTIQAQILKLLRDLRRESNMAVLFITHDLGVIAEIADRVAVLYAGRVAETASVLALFESARHPYTRALLSAIPRTSGPRDRLESIPGTVPVLGDMPPGCRFAPRCPLRRDICDTLPPPLRPLDTAHATACLEPFGFPPADRAA